MLETVISRQPLIWITEQEIGGEIKMIQKIRITEKQAALIEDRFQTDFLDDGKNYQYDECDFNYDDMMKAQEIVLNQCNRKVLNKSEWNNAVPELLKNCVEYSTYVCAYVGESDYGGRIRTMNAVERKLEQLGIIVYGAIA